MLLDFFRHICLLVFVVEVLSDIDQILPTAKREEFECPEQNYNTRIFSTSPLMLYIENFVSVREARELISLAEPSFTTALVLNTENGTIGVNPDIRIADTAVMGSSFTLDCIARRAAAMQGVAITRLEALQVVRYKIDGYFHKHVDWIGNSCTLDWCKGSGDRQTSFFVYLEADCEGGETEFHEMFLPDLMRDGWCDVANCEETGQKTLRWRPIAGNAIFWENLDSEGKGMDQMAHAGLPVTFGSKIGLNIWTREHDIDG